MLWDVKAHLYYLFRWLPPFGLLRARECRLLAGLLGDAIPATGRVLDIAAGTGDSLAWMHKGPAVYAVDKSRAMLSYVRRRFPGVLVVRADALMLPFRTGAFDRVCCIGLAEYLPEPSRLLAGIANCLRPKGVAVVSTSPRNLLFGLRCILGHRLYYHPPALMETAAAAVGLAVEKVAPSFSQWLYVLRKTVLEEGCVPEEEKAVGFTKRSL